MPLADDPDDDTLVEECIEELDDALMSLDRYPPAAVAIATGIWLEGLLGALLDEGQCTAGEICEFLRAIEDGVLAQQHKEA